MRYLYRFLLLLFLSVLFACSRSVYFYEPQPVDLKVIDKNGRLEVVGESVLQLCDSFVWGGSPIRVEDKYYLFFSAWESGPEIPHFSDSWVLYSKVGVAVSDYPDKKFSSLGIFLKGRKEEGDSTAWDAQSAHNPSIKLFADYFYLYYVSSVDLGVQPLGSLGEKLSKRNRVQQNQKIGVVKFKTIDDFISGNYTRYSSPLLAPRTRVKDGNVINPSPEGTVSKPDNLIVVNPAVVCRSSDDKYLLYFKGNFYDPSWRGVHGVAIGDTPTGPFEALDHPVFDVDDGTGAKVSAEDPFVWYHRKDKCFYAVVKDFTGKLTRSDPGLAMLQSKDGLEWTPAEEPFFMKRELILSNGETLQVNRLERPQLLLDKNDDPIVLFAACSIDDCNNKKDGGTFNVHIPLIKKKRKRVNR